MSKKKSLIVAGFLVIVVAVALILKLSFPKVDENTTEVYSFHGQTIQLFSNGNFEAVLAHGVHKSGIFTRNTDGGRTVISFNINGVIENGFIIDNSLHIPREWDDGHGHGNVFPRVNQGTPSRQHGHSH